MCAQCSRELWVFDRRNFSGQRLEASFKYVETRVTGEN